MCKIELNAAIFTIFLIKIVDLKSTNWKIAQRILKKLNEFEREVFPP